MSTPANSAGVAIYRAQIHRPALQKWARTLPREVGAAIIAEAVQELLYGDCGGMKSLPFVKHVNARRKRRKRSADACDG